MGPVVTVDTREGLRKRRQYGARLYRRCNVKCNDTLFTTPLLDRPNVGNEIILKRLLDGTSSRTKAIFVRH